MNKLEQDLITKIVFKKVFSLIEKIFKRISDFSVSVYIG